MVLDRRGAKGEWNRGSYRNGVRMPQPAADLGQKCTLRELFGVFTTRWTLFGPANYGRVRSPVSREVTSCVRTGRSRAEWQSPTRA